VFHVELRQFPHVARSFNLTREELEARILAPLAAGRTLRWDDRSWNPEKAKVTVYEGRELPVEEMGMGRGWGNVTKDGEDVTERLLSEARRAVSSPPVLEALKEAIAARAAAHPIGYYELLGVAGELADTADADQRAGLAARAVWELLAEELLLLVGPVGGGVGGVVRHPGS
jgi:hypothetical protein